MSATDDFVQSLLELLFLNTDFTNIGDSGGLLGSAAAGSYYLSLMTSDPGTSGVQTTNEATYAGYARIAIPRTSSGFVRSGNAVLLTSDRVFADATGGDGQVLRYAGLGTAASGAGRLLLYGALSPIITVATGKAPRIKSSTTSFTITG